MGGNNQENYINKKQIRVREKVMKRGGKQRQNNIHITKVSGKSKQNTRKDLLFKITI